MDPSPLTITPYDMAAWLLNPMVAIPSIYLGIQRLDKRLGLKAESKLRIAFGLSLLAPVAGVGIYVWGGALAFTPDLLLVLVPAMGNFIGATTLHDVLDDVARGAVATSSTSATSAVMPTVAAPTVSPSPAASQSNSSGPPAASKEQ